MPCRCERVSSEVELTVGLDPEQSDRDGHVEVAEPPERSDAGE